MRGMSSGAGEASELKGQRLCGDKACNGGCSEEEEGPGKGLPGRSWASALLVALTDMVCEHGLPMLSHQAAATASFCVWAALCRSSERDDSG